MKIAFSDGEENRIHETYKERKEICQLFEEGQEYSINFKVTDEALATFILSNQLHRATPELNLGIEVTQINFFPAKSNDELERAVIDAVQDVFKRQ